MKILVTGHKGYIGSHLYSNLRRLGHDVHGNGDGVPRSPYGLHKLISEMECRLFSELYGLDTVCLRYFNVYSEDQPFGGSYSTAISAWMQMIREGKPLRIDGDGEQTRDFIHVDDVVLANIYAMQSTTQFGGKSYDVGTGKSVSLNYIKNFINSKQNVEWIYSSERKGDIRHSVSDVSNFKDLGFEALVSIQKGLERCFKGD